MWKMFRIIRTKYEMPEGHPWKKGQRALIIGAYANMGDWSSPEGGWDTPAVGTIVEIYHPDWQPNDDHPANFYPRYKIQLETGEFRGANGCYMELTDKPLSRIEKCPTCNKPLNDNSKYGIIYGG